MKLKMQVNSKQIQFLTSLCISLHDYCKTARLINSNSEKKKMNIKIYIIQDIVVVITRYTFHLETNYFHYLTGQFFRLLLSNHIDTDMQKGTPCHMVTV